MRGKNPQLCPFTGLFLPFLGYTARMPLFSRISLDSSRDFALNLQVFAEYLWVAACVFFFMVTLYIVFTALKWMALWRYAVLFCLCHVKIRVHLFIYLLIYVMTGSLFDWYCYGVSHNQHKVWIKAFQIFLKKFIMRENIFARITKFT